MKKTLAIAGMLFSLAFTGAVNAATGTTVGLITKVHWWEGHTGVLLQQVGMSDLGGCGRSDYYILDDQHPYFKEIYALILTSYTTSQPLTLSIDGCTQGISRVKHITSSK